MAEKRDSPIVKGFICKPPHPQAPKSVQSNITINLESFMAFFNDEIKKNVVDHPQYGKSVYLTQLANADGFFFVIDTYKTDKTREDIASGKLTKDGYVKTSTPQQPSKSNDEFDVF